HQLSQAAAGDYLLFTDADTTHAPGTVTAVLDFARRQDADLVSPWPRFITRSLGEQLIVPMAVLMGFTLCPHWLVVLLQRYPGAARWLGPRFTGALGSANGQFLFFKRQGYDRIGGHAAVRASLAEDVAIGRAVTARMAEGMRLFNCEALGFSSVRMYRSFSESRAGFTKNLCALFDSRPIPFFIFVLGLWVCFLAPCMSWIWAPAQAWPLLRIELAILVIIRILVTIRFRLTWSGALLHPLGAAIFIGIALSSWWASHTSGVSWKGRTYGTAGRSK
ncbi:MAG: glycosyltransferase, partial [Chloroflexi bacterium]|nr:glycosyltransferase [Chloroflexota bacterium]